MFRNCKNQEDLKSLFKKLAFRLHPDHGGSNELMILCKDCFDESLEKLAKTAEPKKEIKIERSNYEPYEKTYQDVFLSDERMSIINKIKKYGFHHKSFKLDFVESVFDFLSDNYYITSGQYNSLVNIYYSFRINEYILKNFPEEDFSFNL